MQLQIEVMFSASDAAQPPVLAAAVRKVVDAVGLRAVDLDDALRDGVLRGVISSERVLDLAMIDVVADFRLTVF